MQNKHQSISKAHNKGKQFENKENVKLISTKNIINNRNASLLSQQYLILRPFGSILLERDPPDNSSFSLVNPKICFKPYLTETTILDIVLPKVNIFSNFFKEIYEENYKNCDSLKEPTILLNGERVRINEKCIFEEVECKKSDFFERKYVSENFGLTDFEIGKPLGKGRFGTVFLVKFFYFL